LHANASIAGTTLDSLSRLLPPAAVRTSRSTQHSFSTDILVLCLAEVTNLWLPTILLSSLQPYFTIIYTIYSNKEAPKQKLLSSAKSKGLSVRGPAKYIQK